MAEEAVSRSPGVEGGLLDVIVDGAAARTHAGSLVRQGGGRLRLRVLQQLVYIVKGRLSICMHTYTAFS